MAVTPNPAVNRTLRIKPRKAGYLERLAIEMNQPPPVTLGTTIVRLLITVLSYFVFGFGLLFLIGFFPGFVVAFPPDDVAAPFLLLVWVYAITSYMTMSIGWVANRRIARFWPISGTVAGILSLLVLPGYALMQEPSSRSYSVAALFSPLIAETMFLLPNIIVAVFLVRFHLRPLDILNGREHR